MNRLRPIRMLAWLALVGLLPLAGARAGAYTWNRPAGVTDNWFTATNWLPEGGPTNAGDSAVITNGCVVLTQETAALADFTLTNAVMVFSNWTTKLTASNVTILGGGTVTVASAFTTNAGLSNRVWIVCTNLTVATNGAINADGKGYAGKAADAGYGPGGGARYCGGGYGGRGGGGGGNPYSSTNAPLEPGSAGGGNNSAGGAGGGAVRIDASGDMAVHGSITANGAAGDYGGGSGGGIYITCAGAFSGGASGALRANGGSNNRGGGGGRIAVDCANLVPANIKLRFSAAAGTGASPPAGMGTLYLANTNLLSETLDLFDSVRVCIPDFTAWNVAGLNLSNRVVGLGPLDGAFTNLAVANDLVITNGGLSLGGVAVSNGVSEVGAGPASNPAVTVGGNLTLLGGGALTLGVSGSGSKVGLAVGANVALDGGALVVGGLLQAIQGEVSVGNDLLLTNGGSLTVYGGMTNAANTNYGALVTVTGALAVGSACWVYPYSHPTNGGSVLFRAGSLLVAANGGFNADGKGYHGNKGAPYPPGYSPYYPANGPGGGGYIAGGGYGGRGGDGNGVGTGGNSNGLPNGIIAPGSAGGGNDGGSPLGGAGGGLVRIEAAGEVTVNGVITANGTNAVSGGAGGGIFIACAGEFSGGTNSQLLANGGGAPTWGAGGGGRISVAIGLAPDALAELIAGEDVAGLYAYQDHAAFLGAIAVTNGVSGTTNRNGESGSRVFLTTNQYRLTIKGQPATYGIPVPDGYGTRIGLPFNTPVTNSVTTPTNFSASIRRACFGWTLAEEGGAAVSSGASTQAVFALSTNLVLTWHWTNEYLLTVLSGSTNGSVNSNTVNGWYTNGVAVTGIAATGAVGYVFSEWTGDVPTADKTNNPLTVAMDQARTITANFYSEAGEAKLWTGTGIWESATNWSPSGMPSIYDQVVIASGAVVIGTARQVKSLVVSNGATLVFSNWTTSLTASNVTILSGGTVTVASAFTTNAGLSNRVWIVCTNLTVATNGAINADGKGYAGKAADAGYGPGGGARYCGGGYGGRGGGGGGNPYSSTNAPLEPGSAGGGNNSAGGAGGGAVRIDASGDMAVHGSITANGAAGDYGGGSGGGIYITCAGAFSGGASGALRANGGSNNRGGGGGRIAVDCANLVPANIKLRFSAAAGTGASPPAGMGTLYLANTNLLSETLDLFDSVRVCIPDFTAWNVAGLNLSNRVVGLGPLDGAFTNLAVANDLVITNGGLSLGGVAVSNGVSEVGAGPASNPAVTVGGNLTLLGGGALTLGVSGSGSKVGLAVGANVALDGGALVVGGLLQAIQGEVSVGNDLLLTNGGSLTVYGGMTNAANTNYGALVTVTGALAVGSACWVYPYSHPTNGGSVLFRAGSLLVAANGGFNADGKGYHGNKGAPYPPGYSPYYPANGPGGGGYIAGGGYGGRGGDGNGVGTGGNSNGLPNGIIAPGSAGGGNDGGSPLGGAGGGLVRIEAAGEVTVNGVITANGTNTGISAGSGGGIFVACEGRFSGLNGQLLANGGNSASWGGGGGGRIAVWAGVPRNIRNRYLTSNGSDGRAVGSLAAWPDFTGTIAANNGTGKYNPPTAGCAYPGTVLFFQYLPGTRMGIR